MPENNKFLLAVDLVGTFVFALEGATVAIGVQLDFFGVMVVSFVTASGGGIIRDLLIGSVPPASIRDRRYLVTAILGGVVVFFLHQFVVQIPSLVIVVLDAAGLGLFAIAGASKALDYGIDPLMSVLMGTITGVGGGTMRDILLSRIPSILRVDIYAVAALVGAAITIFGVNRGMPRNLMMALGITVCFLLRVVSVWQQWNLPKAIS
ncbi:trimeric intracellular cation channel family protein [Tumidithrix elongata RA019]|uniref:Trimeric intracellular cation channel family protein n=1 Tax=Tumidithrix elongata BACA0141 TaxID=2716417 RepID=A0AAW9PUG4_9CYAN|nr:trimeric intracellular cation channel family protein [Tumidithrix elongata RA019]